MALRFLQGAKAFGKTVTASTLTLNHLRCGRPTGCRRIDPLHTAARLRYRVHSLAEPIGCRGPSEEPLTVCEVLASGVEDLASAAFRNLDWDWLTDQLDGVT